VDAWRQMESMPVVSETTMITVGGCRPAQGAEEDGCCGPSRRFLIDDRRGGFAAALFILGPRS
jgi:hypothetical protein